MPVKGLLRKKSTPDDRLPTRQSLDSAGGTGRPMVSGPVSLQANVPPQRSSQPARLKSSRSASQEPRMRAPAQAQPSGPPPTQLNASIPPPPTGAGFTRLASGSGSGSISQLYNGSGAPGVGRQLPWDNNGQPPQPRSRPSLDGGYPSQYNSPAMPPSSSRSSPTKHRSRDYTFDDAPLSGLGSPSPPSLSSPTSNTPGLAGYGRPPASRAQTEQKTPQSTSPPLAHHPRSQPVMNSRRTSQQQPLPPGASPPLPMGASGAMPGSPPSSATSEQRQRSLRRVSGARRPSVSRPDGGNAFGQGSPGPASSPSPPIPMSGVSGPSIPVGGIWPGSVGVPITGTGSIMPGMVRPNVMPGVIPPQYPPGPAMDMRQFSAPAAPVFHAAGEDRFSRPKMPAMHSQPQVPQISQMQQMPPMPPMPQAPPTHRTSLERTERKASVSRGPLPVPPSPATQQPPPPLQPQQQSHRLHKVGHVPLPNAQPQPQPAAPAQPQFQQNAPGAPQQRRMSHQSQHTTQRTPDSTAPVDSRANRRSREFANQLAPTPAPVPPVAYDSRMNRQSREFTSPPTPAQSDPRTNRRSRDLSIPATPANGVPQTQSNPQANRRSRDLSATPDARARRASRELTNGAPAHQQHQGSLRPSPSQQLAQQHRQSVEIQPAFTGAMPQRGRPRIFASLDPDPEPEPTPEPVCADAMTNHLVSPDHIGTAGDESDYEDAHSHASFHSVRTAPTAEDEPAAPNDSGTDARGRRTQRNLDDRSDSQTLNSLPERWGEGQFAPTPPPVPQEQLLQPVGDPSFAHLGLALRPTSQTEFLATFEKALGDDAETLVQAAESAQEQHQQHASRGAVGVIRRGSAKRFGSLVRRFSKRRGRGGDGSEPTTPLADAAQNEMAAQQHPDAGDIPDEEDDTPPPPMRPRSQVLSVYSTKPEEPPVYPLLEHLQYPALLNGLLACLSLVECNVLLLVNKAAREMIGARRILREEVLERFLCTVGYRRWVSGKEPLTLRLEDINWYLRSVSIPTHQYGLAATAYLQNPRDLELLATLSANRASCRAYTRVVLRLRAQAEREQEDEATSPTSYAPPPSKTLGGRSFSRSSSRAPSPSYHGHEPRSQSRARPPLATINASSARAHSFKSPLYRLRRAPLLRVFVPSPEGDWLSDDSVEKCEEELRTAGAVGLMRPGDIVWDAAVGDEGNVGRLVWDGNFLIDLNYSWSPSGDLPKYLHSLAFPPSYFHRVIRAAGNPVGYIDLTPWGEEIASNLQLLQDRVRTETPQGGHHMVVRWVHRSSFVIRPRPTLPGSSPSRIPIPHTDLHVDPGWYGTVVVEAEGTNEGLADLQERCGKGAFHALAGYASRHARLDDIRRVFRVLRERSRPGELWIRVVSDKERLQ